MMRFAPPSLRSLHRDERGASLIEFGFLAPVLALMVGGIIDLSQGIAARFALQQAVNRSLEIVQARPPEAAANQSTVDYSYITAEAAAAAGVANAEPHVKLTKWLQCTDPAGVVTKPTGSAATCPTGSETSRYIKITIQKAFVGHFYLDTVQMSASGAMRIQ